MAEQPVNLLTAIYLGVFSRAEQRVLQAIFKAIAEGGGRCVATLAMLARDSNTSKSTTRNAITRAVEIGLLEKTERRSSCAVSLSNILTYGEHSLESPPSILRLRWPVSERLSCTARNWDVIWPELKVARPTRSPRHDCSHVLAATNKCLAQSNKSRIRRKATNKYEIRQPLNPSMSEEPTGTRAALSRRGAGASKPSDIGVLPMNPFRCWRDEPVSRAETEHRPLIGRLCHDETSEF